MFSISRKGNVARSTHLIQSHYRGIALHWLSNFIGIVISLDDGSWGMVFIQVHIEFHEGQDKILVEGPPEEVNEAVKLLEVKVKELVCIEIQR